MKATPHRTQPHRPWSVWLAVFIVVLAALAPTVTHALMLARGQQVPQRLEICTNQGSRWVLSETDAVASTDDSSPLPGSLVLPEHCPFCLQPTDRVAPPPHLLPYLISVQGGQPATPVWQAFFYRATPAFAPPPRGPPGLL